MWRVAHFAAAYVADQHRRAAAAERPALLAAMEAVRIPLTPTAVLGGVTVPAATQATPLAMPSHFVVIDAAGALRLGRLPVVRLTAAGARLDRASRGEAIVAVADVARLVELLKPVATAQDGAAPPPDSEPPPEPEDEPEDDEDGAQASGGTGSMVLLEEGKAGAARGEGQIHFKHSDREPGLARQQALDQARQAGILGNPDLLAAELAKPEPDLDPSTAGPAGAPLGSGSATSNSYGATLRRPRSRWWVVGLPVPVGPEQALVLVDRAASALRVVEVLDAMPFGGVLAVEVDGQLAMFPLGFDVGLYVGWSAGFDSLATRLVLDVGPAAIVARDSSGVELAQVAVTEGAIADGLAAVVAAGRAAFPDRTDAVVAVREGASAAELVTVLDVALVAGLRGLALQDHVEPSKLPMLRLGTPEIAGDLEPAIVRRYLRRNLAKLKACYVAALAAQPALQGTTLANFFISPAGTVASSGTERVDPAMGRCIAGVLKAIEYPKPRGGGGALVHVPITFRPTGG